MGIARGLEGLVWTQGLRPPLQSLLVLAAGGVPSALLILLAFDWLGIADFRSTLGTLLRRRKPQPAGAAQP